MNVRSLGYRTDLLFSRFAGEVTDCGDHLAIRTPSNPTYYWGNFLLFEGPPQAGDLDRWRETFAREIGTPSDVSHIALGWDGTEGERGDIHPFIEAGFELESSIVLSTDKVHRPPKVCEEAEVRPLSTDWEWNAVIENQVAGRDARFSEAGYREYVTPKVRTYRAMTEAGLGYWFGAFIDGRLAGDLGLFVFDGLGRFQVVGTHPDFRRRGVCGSLVHETAAFALEQMGAQRLVMVADPEYHAAKIYESIGFVPVERQMGLTLYP